MKNRGGSKLREPAGSPLRRELLLSTHAAGVRWREAWFVQLAADSRRFSWSFAQIDAAVMKDVAAAAAAKRLSNISTLASEGRLAADPSVRGEIERLMAIRDEVCATEPDLIRRTLQRPTHVLVLLMRLNRKGNLRHHTADGSVFLQYLQRQLATRPSKKAIPNSEKARPRATHPDHVPLVAQRVPRIALTYQTDQATHEALRQRSFHTGTPIQRLIDSAVRSWLQEQSALGPRR
jgi:hypothetical protein